MYNLYAFLFHMLLSQFLVRSFILIKLATKKTVIIIKKKQQQNLQ